MPFKPGQSGNPGGRKKKTQEEFDLIAACRQRSTEALQVILSIMEHGRDDRVRLSAAMAILDRAYGSVAVQPPGKDEPPPLRVSVSLVDASTPDPGG
jgi:hypothetical protein